MHCQTQKEKKKKVKPRIKIEPEHVYCHSVRESSADLGRKCASTVRLLMQTRFLCA